jgi:hypothetical protein
LKAFFALTRKALHENGPASVAITVETINAYHSKTVSSVFLPFTSLVTKQRQKPLIQCGNRKNQSCKTSAIVLNNLYASTTANGSSPKTCINCLPIDADLRKDETTDEALRRLKKE